VLLFDYSSTVGRLALKRKCIFPSGISSSAISSIHFSYLGRECVSYVMLGYYFFYCRGDLTSDFSLHGNESMQVAAITNSVVPFFSYIEDMTGRI
jgi:hypothetical protein